MMGICISSSVWTHHLTPVTTSQQLKLLPEKNNLFSQSSFCYSLNFNWWVHSGSLSLVCLSCLAECAAQHPPSLSCLPLTCKRGWFLPDQAGPLQFCVAPLIYTAGLNLEGVSGLLCHLTTRTQKFACKYLHILNKCWGRWSLCLGMGREQFRIFANRLLFLLDEVSRLDQIYFSSVSSTWWYNW